jgi:hypothetical protein
MAQHGYLREYDEGWEDRGEERERGWRERDLGERDRNRGFMFGGREQRGDWERAPRNFSTTTDEHYRAWRDQHMREVDRDYEQYRRERERQFHADFNAWRRQRHGNNPPLQPGMTQTGMSTDPTGTLELTNDSALEPKNSPDPMDTATLGTTSGGSRR